jgi:hypothetical protein
MVDGAAMYRAVVLLLLSVWIVGGALPHAAAAFSTGITGWSGIRGPYCNKCHRGGAIPSIRIEGPQELRGGETAEYRFVVESHGDSQIAAGFNVAATAGRLGTVANEGAQLFEGELTHLRPKTNSAGAAAWRFTWTAPLGDGAQTLWAAGNSVDLNGTSGGDGAADITLAVQVLGTPSTPTPTETPTPTATPSPTETPLPPCVGDCDGDRTVSVAELVVGVDVALGRLAAEACTALDEDGNRSVSVDELTAAVSNTLNGCR